MIPYTAEDVDRIIAEIEASSEEACAENPDVNPDDVYHDIAWSVLMMVEVTLRDDIWRRLGFSPPGEIDDEF